MLGRGLALADGEGLQARDEIEVGEVAQGSEEFVRHAYLYHRCRTQWVRSEATESFSVNAFWGAITLAARSGLPRPSDFGRTNWDSTSSQYGVAWHRRGDADRGRPQSCRCPSPRRYRS